MHAGVHPLACGRLSFVVAIRARKAYQLIMSCLPALTLWWKTDFNIVCGDFLYRRAGKLCMYEYLIRSHQ